MQSYTLTYTLTREAYTAYNLYYLTHSPSIRRMLLLGQFVPPALVMLVCGLLYLSSRMTATFACIASGVTYGVFVLFYPMLFRNGVKRRLGKIVAEGIGREFIGEHRLELREAGIRDGSQSGYVVEVPYANVERAIENDGHLYVFIGQTAAFVIPLDAFGSENGKAAFLAALVEKGAHFRRE
jgi:hypothetical protein